MLHLFPHWLFSRPCVASPVHMVSHLTIVDTCCELVTILVSHIRWILQSCNLFLHFTVN
uniref:Uncharacterized protein n=1 Tax=Triticum urartu TaxID=4572 RepID=A0A8R7U5R4_TRIUA